MKLALPALVLLAWVACASAPARASDRPAAPFGVRASLPGPAVRASSRTVSIASGTVVVWAETRRGVSRVFAQRLDASGVPQWPDSGLAVSAAAGNQTMPLAFPGAGDRVIVSWMNGVAGGVRMMAQALDPTGAPQWGAAGVVAGAVVSESDVPAGAADGRGGVLLVWDEFVGDNIHAQRVDASGTARWGGGGDLLVAQSSGLAIFPSVSPDGAGGAIVAWQDHRGGNYDILAARVDSAGATRWQSSVCLAAGDQWSPQAAPDTTGGAIVTWQDYRSGVADIYAQRLDAAGATLWASGGIPVCTATGQQYLPVIVADGAGGGVIAWQDYRSDPSAVRAQIYAQRVTGAGTTSWAGNGVAAGPAAGGEFAPAPLADGAGGVLLAWQDTRNGSYDVYAQHLSAAGSALWTAGGVAMCIAPGNQVTPAVASDGAGGMVAWWSDARVGDADIYAQRVDAGGAPQWNTSGVPVYLTPGVQFDPLAVASGGGGLILVWKEKRAGDYDIAAARFSPSGAPLWQQTRVCYAPGVQAPADAVSDGAGGVIVTWQDPRGADLDIYAQRVDSTGTAAWATDGAPVCTAPGDQSSPRVIPDGAGGAIVVWQDARGTSLDIYAQRLGADGTQLWAAGGAALCTAAGDQTLPRLDSDGAGGAIATWQDARAGTPHVFAQRIAAGGATQWFPGGVAVCADTSNSGQRGPALVADTAGGAIVAWSDGRGQAYAQHLDGSGATLWAANGVAMATTLRGGAVLASMVPDGAGGAIVAWLANADTAFCPEACAQGLFAQRVTGAGQLRWLTTYGSTVSLADPSPAVTAPDQVGGAILAFNQNSSGRELVGQYLDGAGAAAWGAGGVPVATTAGTRLAPAIAADGAGGALVAWQQSDGYRALVHAQRFDPAGNRLWSRDDVTGVGRPPQGPGAAGLSLALSGPNPCRGVIGLRFTLPDAGGAATLELLDVSGRRVGVRALAGLGAGPHAARFGGGERLPAGVYLVRLRQGSHARTLKAVVLD